MSEEELKKEMEELVKNKMDTFIECYKNGMIFGTPTDIEFYEKIATLQQKVEQLEKEYEEADNDRHQLFDKYEQLENIRKEAIEKLKEIVLYDEYVTIHSDFINDTLNILNKGSEE